MLAVIFLFGGILAGNAQAEIVIKPRVFRPLVIEQNSVKTPMRIGVATRKQSRTDKNKNRLRQLVSSGQIKLLLSDEQLRALILVESGGKAGLIGDKHLGSDSSLWAYGKLQIRQCYVNDVNRDYGTNILSLDCLWDDELSILVTQAYMNIYAPNHSFQNRAKIHNGGPNGPSVRKTAAYWTKVQEKLKAIRS